MARIVAANFFCTPSQMFSRCVIVVEGLKNDYIFSTTITQRLKIVNKYYVAEFFVEDLFGTQRLQNDYTIYLLFVDDFVRRCLNLSYSCVQLRAVL